MSNFGWTNADGEPIMDGAAYRFEQALDADSRDDYYADHFYDDERPEPIDPDDCDHPDGTYLGSGVEGATGGDFECDACETIAGRWVRRDDGWPERV